MNSRAKSHQAYVPTDTEHLANVVTHGVCTVVRQSVNLSLPSSSACRLQLVRLASLKHTCSTQYPSYV